eukprot:4263107-Alexandrium_andersonii.AAC.1
MAHSCRPAHLDTSACTRSGREGLREGQRSWNEQQERARNHLAMAWGVAFVARTAPQPSVVKVHARAT